MAARDINDLRCELVRRLRYDPCTGVFTNRQTGKVVGRITSKGYVSIRLNGGRYLAHRLIWLYCYGYVPTELEVDHIDGNKANNRFRNLRLGTHSANLENLKTARADNVCGFLGVGKKHGRFRVRIMVSGMDIPLGRYRTPELAHEAYLAAKRELHEFNTL